MAASWFTGAAGVASIVPFWICLWHLADGVTDKNALQAYCQSEYFEATCGDGQAVLMESAQYGRMQIGSCVKGDYGHLGCSVDALFYMDYACSGSRTCQFRIYDSKLRKTLNPCPEDMSSYLEASYNCIEVTSAQRAQCDVLKYLKVTSSSGYLASIEAEEHGFGTVSCPWVLHGSKGQTISLSLLNFAQTPEHASQKGGCYELAVIYEGSDSRSITTCDGDRRAAVIYKSVGNEVRLQMVSKEALKTLGKFLVKYKVSGCPHIPAPANATLKREGDNLAIKCNNSDQTWYLVCKGDQWLGDVGNCSAIVAGGKQWKLGQIFSNESFPYGILIVVAIGVALGVFCGGILLTCAAMYMKRRRRDPRDVVHYTDEQDRFVTMERSRRPEVMGPLDTLECKKVIVCPGKDPKCRDGSCLQNFDNEKQLCGTYGRSMTIPPGVGTYPPRHHVYETPRFV